MHTKIHTLEGWLRHCEQLHPRNIDMGLDRVREVARRMALRFDCPVITVAGLQLGALIAFSIITETVFQWPGLGLLIIQAITFGDIPLIAAYLLVVALLFVTINTVVDLLYFRVDPRVRTVEFSRQALG